MQLGAKTQYVLVNILVSILSLVRNLLFLKIFGLAELGQVALMQTTIMLVSMSQCGLINGGYRIYAEGDQKRNAQVNDTLFTAFLMLLCVSLAGSAVALSAGMRSYFEPMTLLLGLMAGIATLASTWVNNALIGDGKLHESNLVNTIAVTSSCAVALLAFPFGLKAALASLFVQPLMIIGAALLLIPTLRPRRLQFKRGLVRAILGYGFIPFAAGIFVLLNQQLERWAITTLLGTEQLGRFYLVIVYTSIFTLVPTSLLNLYFPRAVRAYSETRLTEFKDVMKIHARHLAAYLVCAVATTALLLPWVLAAVFPQYANEARLIFLALPALLIATLCDPIAIILNTTKCLSPLLLSGLFGLLANLALIGVLWGFEQYSIETGLAARAGAAAISACFLLWACRSLPILKNPDH